jgi:hypothetical protein
MGEAVEEDAIDSDGGFHGSPWIKFLVSFQESLKSRGN